MINIKYYKQNITNMSNDYSCNYYYYTLIPIGIDTYLTEIKIDN